MSNAMQKHNFDPGERRRRDLAMIHLAKKQLDLNEDEYRSCLRNVTGFESAALLDDDGRRKMISWFRINGFRSSNSYAKPSGMHVSASVDRAPLLSKIGAILTELRLPWAYADGIARQMFKVRLVRWIYPDQLKAVLVALIKLQEKNQQKEAHFER